MKNNTAVLVLVLFCSVLAHGQVNSPASKQPAEWSLSLKTGGAPWEKKFQVELNQAGKLVVTEQNPDKKPGNTISKINVNLSAKDAQEIYEHTLKAFRAVPFGVNGIRMDENYENVYVSVTAENGTLDGVIYRLPLADPTAANLDEFFRYPFFPAFQLAGPDGIAFGRSGKLYVALAGTSQISVLRPDGTEEARYSGPADNPGGSPDPMPWANPANIAFDIHTGSLLVTNHASLVPFNPSLFVVFSVYVDDKAQPLP